MIFDEKAHYQTEYQGILRQDEITCFIKLLDTIDLKVYGANNAMLKAKLTKRLRAFKRVEN